MLSHFRRLSEYNINITCHRLSVPRPSFQTFKVTSGQHRLELYASYKMDSDSLSLSVTIHPEYKLVLCHFCLTSPTLDNVSVLDFSSL